MHRITFERSQTVGRMKRPCVRAMTLIFRSSIQSYLTVTANMRIGLPWDNKDKSPPPGASFFESDRPRTSTPSLVHSAFRKLSQDNSPGPSAPGAPTPLLALKLSTISFLDSVVNDGVSDNALYVIETEENSTRIRRSDTKGFINVARVRWREEPNYFSRGKKDLSGVMLAFGKGHWKPADDFLGYSYSSITS